MLSDLHLKHRHVSVYKNSDILGNIFLRRFAICKFLGQRPHSELGSEDFDFTEVTDAIKNNSTGVDIAKKVLSKLAKLTERSEDSNSLFMMWTMPTTVLALMGIVYFVGK